MRNSFRTLSTNIGLNEEALDFIIITIIIIIIIIIIITVCIQNTERKWKNFQLILELFILNVFFY